MAIDYGLIIGTHSETNPKPDLWTSLRCWWKGERLPEWQRFGEVLVDDGTEFGKVVWMPCYCKVGDLLSFDPPITTVAQDSLLGVEFYKTTKGRLDALWRHRKENRNRMMRDELGTYIYGDRRMSPTPFLHRKPRPDPDTPATPVV